MLIWYGASHVLETVTLILISKSFTVFILLPEPTGHSRTERNTPEAAFLSLTVSAPEVQSAGSIKLN